MHTRTSIDFTSVSISGDRIRLIPISSQYANIIFKEFTEEITRLMIPAPPGKIEQVHDYINSCITNMQNHSELTFVILKRDSEEFLGVCALHGHPCPDEPILGIWLKKAAHGNRFGQEAIKHLADWSKQNLNIKFMVYPCDQDNIPSIKIAESLNGTIIRIGEVKSMSGRTLKEIAYKII